MRWHAYQVIIILVPVTLLLLPLVSTEEWLLQGTGHPTSLPLDTALGAELVLKSLRRSGDCKALRFDSAKLWFMQKRGECFFAHFVNLYQICPRATQEGILSFSICCLIPEDCLGDMCKCSALGCTQAHGPLPAPRLSSWVGFIHCTLPSLRKSPF